MALPRRAAETMARAARLTIFPLPFPVPPFDVKIYAHQRSGNARLPAGLSPCCRRWWGSPPLPDALSSRQGISLPQARFYAFNPRRHILAPVTKRKTDFFAVTRGVVRTVVC
ncbi:transcriptional regulator [Klebsiella pneumoniae]|uniref:Transcriptional regulator n=1 Tax=Klebsiella pneumoniae TaxID=573 RepID=A0A447S6Z4_KLEPN|nr:transcriptional regulator [Klebsiella pneumoniae]